MPRAPRSQADRDATTVEIAYALASAAFLAALVFGVIAGPCLVWRLPRSLDRTLLLTGALVATTSAVIRVVHVLRPHARAEHD